MNEDDLAAYVRHVTHKPVPTGASPAELLAILARRYELLEYGLLRTAERLADVIASIRAVAPQPADVPPGSSQQG